MWLQVLVWYNPSMLSLSERHGLKSNVKVPLTCVCRTLYGPLVLVLNLQGLNFSQVPLLKEIVIAMLFLFLTFSDKFLFNTFYHLCVMAWCQSAIKGRLRNKSLKKVRLPRLLSKVECIPALIACIAMDIASSTYPLPLAYFEVVPHVIMFLKCFLLFDAFFCTQNLLWIFGCSISDMTILF